MTKIINLTPHSINLIDADVSIAPSGAIARVFLYDTSMKPVYYMGKSIPVITSTPGEIFDLPDQKANTIYIVSTMVRLALPDRKDLFSPSSLVRDDQGMIIGANTLTRN